jgi:hypothetical protein
MSVEVSIYNPFRDDYLDVEFPDAERSTFAFSDAEADEILYGRMQEGINNLSSGPGYTTKEVEVPYPIMNPYGVPMPVNYNNTYKKSVRSKDFKTFVNENAPKALGINSNKFKKLPTNYGDLTALSFLKDPISQKAYLSDKYGEKNVQQFNVNGSMTNFYSPDDGESWGLVDDYGYDLFEFAADASSEIVPMSAALYGTLKTGVATGGFGLIKAPTVFNVIYGTSGAAQDAFARSILGVDVKAGEIAERRTKEFALNMGADMIFLGAGKAGSKLFFGQRFDDIAAREATAVLKDLKNIPLFVQRGGQERGTMNLIRAQELASKYPNSAGAKFYNEARELGVTGFVNEFGYFNLTPQQADNILRESLETITRQQADDVAKIENSLVDLVTQEKALKNTALTEGKAKSLALGEARKTFDTALTNQARRVSTKKSFSPEDTGQSMIQNYAKRYINLESSLYKQFNSVYSKMENINLNVGQISSILNKVKSTAATDAQGTLIVDLTTGTQKFSNRAINSLDEIAEEQINFRQLNEFIQTMETKANRAKIGASPEEAQYRLLTNELRTLRDRLLKQADPQVQKEFNQANVFFKDTILEARSGDIYKYIELAPGQRWKDAIVKNAEGNPYRMPKFKDGGDGTGFLNYAMKSPANMRQTLKALGNDPGSREILRQAYLRKIGLDVNKPIDVNTLKNISDRDIDLGRILFPGQNKTSLSAKMKDIQSLQQFAADKDNFISGIEPDIVQRIMSTEDANVQKKLLEIAEKQVKEQAALDNLNKDVLMKLFADGKLPLPDNQFTMDGLISSFMRAKPADLKAVIQKLAETNPQNLDALQMSLYNWLIDRAGNGAVTSQKAFGDYIWNPVKMEAIIKNNKDNLITILGKEKYDSIFAQNAGIKRFSVGDLDPEGNVSIAGNPFQGTATPFWSGLGSVFTDKMGAMMLAFDIHNPKQFKKMLSREDYFKTMKMWSTASFGASKTYTQLIDQADSDPVYRKELTEFYGNIFHQHRVAVEQVEQGLVEVEEALRTPTLSSISDSDEE